MVYIISFYYLLEEILKYASDNLKPNKKENLFVMNFLDGSENVV